MLALLSYTFCFLANSFLRDDFLFEAGGNVEFVAGMDQSLVLGKEARPCHVFVSGVHSAAKYRMLLNKFVDEPECVWQLARCLCDELEENGISEEVYDMCVLERGLTEI